jgi:hypothetical protein
LERIVSDLAAELSRLGDEVTVACPAESRPPSGVEHLSIGPAKHQVQQDWVQAEKEAYDQYKPQYMAGLYSRQLGVPARCVYNGVPPDDYQFNREDGTRLLYLGRIAKFKQPHVALDVGKRAGAPVDIMGGDHFVEEG